MQFHESFPPHRRRDSRRRAEARVYDEIAASSRPGYAYYEFQFGPHAPELDFIIWLEDVGRFGIQVKGGQYQYRQGLWRLRSLDGSWLAKPCPIAQTWDASLSLVEAVRDVIHRRIFVIPVLLFPDGEPDERARRRVNNSKVCAAWGADGLVDRLAEIAKRVGVRKPPTKTQIRDEFEALTGDRMRLDASSCRPHLQTQPYPVPRPATSQSSPHSNRATVTVGRANVLNLYRRIHPNAGEIPPTDEG